jgi:hypothetical protein
MKNKPYKYNLNIMDGVHIKRKKVTERVFKTTKRYNNNNKLRSPKYFLYYIDFFVSHQPVQYMKKIN